MQFIASDTIAHILLVDGAVRSKAEKFDPRFVRGITMGVVTVLLGVILLVSVSFINENNEPLIIAAAGGLLLFISAGVNTLIRAGMVKDSYSKVFRKRITPRRRKRTRS